MKWSPRRHSSGYLQSYPLANESSNCKKRGIHLTPSREIRDLHFELCYYQPLEYAIAKGLKLFEAGAQGSTRSRAAFFPS